MSCHSYIISYGKANSLSPTFIPTTPKTTVVVGRTRSVYFVGNSCVPRKTLKYSAREFKNFGGIRAAAAAAASDSESTTTTTTSTTAGGGAGSRWLLQPIGDGDTRHIGYKIAMPGAFEIASNVVTVGRVPEKADIVISVPTVSGVHARIENTKENLLITDLDSTNGTFINEKRLVPGLVSPASPGNLVTFGDTNLAIFRVSKLEKEESTSEIETESENEQNT